LEYKGEEYQHFYHLVKHLFNTLKIDNYSIYQGKSREKLQVFIKVDNILLEEAELQLQALTLALKQKITQKWKCLPSALLPDEYNIITLPYQTLLA